MTAVWDEVVECEVIKLGIQCNAMFYSLLQSAGVEEVFFLVNGRYIHCSLCVHYLEHRILPPLTDGFDALLTCSNLFTIRAI